MASVSDIEEVKSGVFGFWIRRNIRTRPNIEYSENDIIRDQKNFRSEFNKWLNRNDLDQYNIQIAYNYQRIAIYNLDNYKSIEIWDNNGESKTEIKFFLGINHSPIEPPDDFAVGYYSWNAIKIENLSPTLDQIFYWFLREI